MMDKELFDADRFLRSLANDPVLAKELLQAWLDDCPERSGALKSAIQEGDTAAASKLAHSIKGMCGVVRSTTLADMAFGMEQAGKEDDLATLTRFFSLFESSMVQAQAAMHAFLNNLE